LGAQFEVQTQAGKPLAISSHLPKVGRALILLVSAVGVKYFHALSFSQRFIKVIPKGNTQRFFNQIGFNRSERSFDASQM